MDSNNLCPSQTDVAVEHDSICRSQEGGRPQWQRPSISLLEVETATLTAGGNFAESGFTSS
jgi:hypothetical protein